MDLDSMCETWWIQLTFWISINVLIYCGIEFWRYCPFINGYIIIILSFTLLPLLFFNDQLTIYLFIKYCQISPILIIVTLWRITYIPNVTKENQSYFFQIWISKLSRFCARYFCNVRQDKFDEIDQYDTNSPRIRTNLIDRRFARRQDGNTSYCMQLFLFVILFGYILIDAFLGFVNGIYTNSICGVLLALTLPIPCKWFYKKNAYYVGDRKEGDEIYDALIPIHWLYVLLFTSWEWVYLWHYYPGKTYIVTLHLLPNLIRALIGRRYDLWFGLRFYCLYIGLLIMIMNDSWNFLQGKYFVFLVDIKMDYPWIFEVFGGINLFMIMIYVIIWINWIYQQRKNDKDIEEYFTANDEVNQSMNTDEDIELI